MPTTIASRWCPAITAGTVIAATLAIAGAVPGRAAARASVVLQGSALHGIETLTALRDTAATTPITLGVGLLHPDPAGEDAYLRAEYDPQNPLFHRFLSPAAYQERFGVPTSRLQSVSAWLQGGGLTVTPVPGATAYVLATGTAAAVDRLLGVTVRDYRVGGVAFHANSAPPTVPADLGIQAIAGLDDLQGPRLQPHVAAAPPAPAAAAALAPQAVGPTTNTGLSTPSVLWDVYHQPAGNRGEGQQMAIFGWGVTDGVQSDLRAFEREYSLPGVPLSVSYYGPASEQVTDTTGAGEWRLDTQASTGMAPNVVAEKLYFGKAGTDPDLIAAYQAWVNDAGGPLQGSSSFGGCEQAPGTNPLGPSTDPSGFLAISNANQSLYEAALKQAVMGGRTMFASTGDTGSSCPVVSVSVNGVGNEAVPLQNYPAVSSYVVAVGGTVLYYNPASGGAPATRALETAWTHTGGGPSSFIKAGDYQLTLPPPGLLTRCTTQSDGTPYPVPPPPCRGVPDVAAQSGDIVSNGYTITVNGANDQAGAGTSLSSPLWLGMWTRIQSAARTAAGNGFADVALYAKPGDFFDIGGASTDTAVTSNGYFSSHPGWDYVSGLGTPDVTKLMTDIDGTTTPLIATTPAPVPTVSGPVLDPCSPLFTGPPGGDTFLGQSGKNPQLAILSGSMAASPDGTKLTTTLVIQNLSTTVPAGGSANEYYMVFVFNKVQYFTNVTVDQTAAIRYGYGHVSGNIYNNDGSATGSFTTGTNGTVVVTVDLAKVGAAKPGDILASPNGQTKELVGNPNVGGALQAVDQAGPRNDYQVGQTCPSTTGGGTTGGGTTGGGTTGGGTTGGGSSGGGSNGGSGGPPPANTGNAPASSACQKQPQGYWLVARDGGIFPFGPGAGGYGSTGNIRLNQPIVGMAARCDGSGYWLVASDGGIFPFGPGAVGYGSTGNIALNQPIVGMAAAPDGGGYWLVAGDGGIFPFGSAQQHSYGSTGNIRLNQPIVGMAVTASGNGYWLVASDGGIFPFGDAQQHSYGSTGGIHLNQPIVGMAPTASGNGYWLVASDGGIFPFGDAVQHSYGSTGGILLNQPIVGMAATVDGNGYWLVASDGGMFPFGPSAGGWGSTGNIRLNQPVLGMAAVG